MKKVIFCLSAVLASALGSYSQNVFNPNDGIVRYSASAALGSSQRPDPAIRGLQKWVSTPTNGVSTGNGSIDVSSFKQYFLNLNGNPMAFRIKFPRSYSNADSAAKKYPVMLFLHGGGEVGCPSNNGVYNNEKQLYLGAGLFRDFVNNNTFDGFLVYPQIVTADCWGSWGTTTTANLNTALSMVDSLGKYARADIDRILVNGLSGGGYGAWRIADVYPMRVAKIIPSAAAGSTTTREDFVHIPIWFATGGKDPDPSPAQADYSLNRMKEIGADIRYTRYEDLGHAVWYRHWREPDYPAAMNETHKANPLVFFGRNEFCAGEFINAKLGLTPGFNAYEWQKDGQVIATRIGTVNTIVDTSVVISMSATGNEINVKKFGVYRARFRRTATGAWSAYSRKPVTVKEKTTTVTPPVTVVGTKSNVLPALDGSTTAPLQMPAGFAGYQWYRVSDSALVSTSQTYNAPVGVYIGRYFEQFGCGTAFSPNFTVVDADGTPKPAAVTALTSTPLNQTQVRLNWTQGTGETGFEVYRGSKSGGPYTFVSLRPANAVTYTDTGLAAGTTYFYVMRSVSGTGASAKSNESVAKTLADVSAPTAPSNLTYRGSTATSVSLRWTASTDNGSIKRYDIYANNVKVFSTTATSFNVVNLDSLTSYTFVVRAIDNNDNVSPPSNQVSGFTHRTGINYKWYTSTTTWTQLPNFNALTPVSTGVTDTIGFNDTRIIGTATTRYGFLWEGLIYIPVTGTYTFETRSDDGTRLYIDVPYAQNATALVVNDSVHGMRTRTGAKLLTQGYHTFALTYYQGVNGLGLELWWSSNVGLARERIPANFLTFTTAAVEPAPTLPTGLLATATAYNKIRLNWTDASSNETGFEIVRSSTSSTGTYSPIGTAPANSNTYTDSLGLTASKQYWYKIRAVTASSESAFTNFVTATTQAAPATPIAPTQLEAVGGVNNTISLTWQDNSSNETGFRVYRSTDGTNFASLGTVGSNNNAFTDMTAAALTTYYYYVVGYNAGGEGGRSNTVNFSAGNNAPVITSLSNMFGKTGQSVSQTFTVTDDPGDVINVRIIKKPAFVSISDLGGGDYRVTIDPTNDNVGFHNLIVTASDNKGESSSDTFSIVVGDAKTRSVYVNFGAADKAAPAPWNNWLGNRTAGNTLVNPVDENNQATPFTIITVNAWTGTTVLGHITGNNSGVVPDAVLESGLLDAGGPKNIRFTGLDRNKLYNVEFVASQNEGIRATANYFNGMQVDSFDARYNTNRTSNLNNLVPDANGIITVTIQRTNQSANTYLNALVLEEFAPADALLNPEHLYAEPTSRTTASLTWSDRTNVENVADGYEVQRARDSLFTIGVTDISLPGNSKKYDDAGLSANTKYWYRVRAKNDGGVSEYSNKFYIVTPASIVSVNFNSNVVNAPFPWNNLEANSLTEFTVNNLVNQSGANSGIAISCTKVFNGEFNAGGNTGANTGVVPDAVLMSDYWLDNSQLSQMKLSGLNHTRKYRIGFIGSSSTPGWFKGNYTAKYTVNGKSVYLNSWMNTTKVVYISDLSPDVNGELLLNFTTTDIAQWAFNAGIIIYEYSDANGGTVQYMSNSTLDSAATIVAPIADDYKLKVYPNPFTDNINIDFNKPSATSKVSTEIYDLTGRLVYRQNFSSMPAGLNTIRINDIRSTSKGVFIVALRIDGKIVRSVKMLRNK